MAQHDYTIANQGFPATREDLNNVLDAIRTNNSGTTPPGEQYAGQFWIDTTSSTWTLYIHDGADDIQFATIDTSANTVNFIDSELGDNSVTTAKIADGNVTSAKLSYPLTTFSSTGIDDNATSTAITIDSSENVGIGTTSTQGRLLINTGASGSTLNPSSMNDGNISFSNASGSTAVPTIVGRSNNNAGLNLIGTSNNSQTGGDLVFDVRENDNTDFATTTGSGFKFSRFGNELMRLTRDGKLGIGTSSPNRQLTVQSTTNAEFSLTAGNSSKSQIFFADTDDTNIGRIEYEHTNNAAVFWTNDAERMRIDSSGNVGIGNTVASTINSANGTGNLVVGSGSGTEGITIYSGTTGEGTLQFADASTGAGTYVGQVNYNHSSNFMSFGANGSERMRIDSSGILLVGKTSSGIINQGGQIHSEGYGGFTVSGNVALYVNRLVDDGELVRFFQDTNLEGNISVSGSTVSYNGFTGTHWSRFTDNSKPTILKGTVLETLDEMCDWYNLEFDVVTQDDDGNDIITPQKIPHVLIDSQSNGDVITYNHEGTDYQATIVKEADVKHMKSKVSNTVDAKNVYGVFVAYDEDGEGYNDFYVASVGSFVVRIKANETIAKGDLLQSNGDGTAKVQTDDNVKSSSFAKVLSTTIIETYDDGSYLVPCSLMC